MANYSMHVAAAAAFPYATPYPQVNPHAMAAAAMAAAAVSSPVMAQPPVRRAKSLPAANSTDDARGVKRPPVTQAVNEHGRGGAAAADVPPPSPKLAKRTEGGVMTPRTELAGKFENCRMGGKDTGTSGVSRGGGIGGSSPNFANIYAFFAKMFDPVGKFDAMKGVGEPGMSPLDKEVIKLLMSNLEINIANTGFRQQLLETYRQQIRQSVQQTVS